MEYCLTVTTHNSGKYIRKTLSSILNNLRSNPPAEVLIFDDASLDDTREEINFLASTFNVPIRFNSSERRRGAKENIAVALLSSLRKYRYVLYCQDDVFALDDKDLLSIVKWNYYSPTVAITFPYAVMEQEINYEGQIYHMRRVIGGQRSFYSEKRIPLDAQFWFLYEIKETKDMVKGFLSSALGEFFDVPLAHRFCFCVDRKFANGTRLKIEEAIHHKSMLDDWFLQIKVKQKGRILLIPPVAVGHLKNTELFYSPDNKLFEDYWEASSLEEIMDRNVPIRRSVQEITRRDLINL